MENCLVVPQKTKHGFTILSAVPPPMYSKTEKTGVQRKNLYIDIHRITVHITQNV